MNTVVQEEGKTMFGHKAKTPAKPFTSLMGAGEDGQPVHQFDQTNGVLAAYESHSPDKQDNSARQAAEGAAISGMVSAGM